MSEDELLQLKGILAELLEPDVFDEWFIMPNPAFDGLKPIEVIERGEIDRLWRMAYQLQSGIAS